MKRIFTITMSILLMLNFCTFSFLPNEAIAQNFGGRAVADDSVNISEFSDEEIDQYALQQAVKEIEQVSSVKVEENRNEQSSRYTLGPLDVLDIAVMRHPELSGQFVINNEGKLQYQFIGDVKVAGLTKDEVKEVILGLVSQYVISPEITVKIVGYNSKTVYVIGEVAVPGKIFMKGDTITIREALVQSGLPLMSASTKKCRLITPTNNGNPDIKYVNVFRLLYEGDLRENYVMKPGDTLYIPATILSKAMRVIQPVSQPITAAAGAGRTVVTGF